MAVEEDARRGIEIAQHGQPGGELVDEEHIGAQAAELARGNGGGGQQEVQLARDGAQDREARGEGAGHERVAAHAHVERAVARLVEAVLRVAVRGEDRHPVAAALQADCCVDDEALGAADAEVGVDEDYVLGAGLGRGRGRGRGVGLGLGFQGHYCGGVWLTIIELRSCFK